MCTLAVWVNAFEGTPLVVAANRDELYSRASRPPFLWDSPAQVVAPRDEVAGGAWWAVSAPGLFVGLTNRAGAMVDASRRSRGGLVIDVAAQRTMALAEAFVAALDPSLFNGFHLVVTDGVSALVTVCDGVTATTRRHGAGRLMVSERSFGAAATSRDPVVAAELDVLEARWRSEGRVDLMLAGEVFARRSNVPFEGPRVHEPDRGYGTRSSTLLRWDGAGPVLLFADGAPDTAPFSDRSALLRTLFTGSSNARE